MQKSHIIVAPPAALIHREVGVLESLHGCVDVVVAVVLEADAEMIGRWRGRGNNKGGASSVRCLLGTDVESVQDLNLGRPAG